jgi:cobalt-zinc-cadmium efflux system outer membrane protein
VRLITHSQVVTKLDQHGSRWLSCAAVATAVVLLSGSPAQAQGAAGPILAPRDERTLCAQPLTVRLPPTTAPDDPRRFAGLQVSAVERQPAENPQPPEPIAPGQTDGTAGMTLDEVTGMALAHSPTIREARNQAMAARGTALQASLYPNPTLGTASPQLAGSETQYNAYVIQDVVTKGKIRLDTAAAQRAACEAEFALVRARFDVLTMVRTRFYTALAIQKRVEVLERMVRIARSALGVSEKLVEQGVGPRSDVLLLQIELSKAEAELKNGRTLAETSRSQLAAATGLINLTIDRVEADLQQPLPDYELIAVQRGVIARNAVARRAEIEIARSQILLRRAEVEPFPNLNLMGGYQNQLSGVKIPENQAIYQVQMVLPLWNRNQGNIRAAQAGVGKAVAQFNRVRTELANDTAAALGRYLTAGQLVERYQTEILPSADEVQRITAQLYTRGQIEFLRYLAAQRDLLSANLAYVDAQQARWVAAAEVAGLLQSEQFP